MDWRWRYRLTDEGYTPLNGEKLPSKLVPKLLMKLYEVSSDCDPQDGKVVRRTLAACRLVCRRWSKIVTSERRRFIIRANGKEWASPSWYMLKCTPLQIQNGLERNQERNPAWLIKNYRTVLIDSHPKFLPELIPNIIAGLRGKLDKDGDWVDEGHTVIQSTLATCCLVSREWYEIFCPTLYEDIFLGAKNLHLTQSLLHRTFRHTQPAHKSLVKRMTIATAEDGSTSNLLSICFSMPNLRKLILDLKGFDPSALHPNFVHQLRSLSKCCIIQMVEDYHGYVKIDWGSLPRYINFIRRSRLASPSLWVDHSGGR